MALSLVLTVEARAQRVDSPSGHRQLAPVLQVVALPQRTFVASTGNDSNPCSRSLPCRNFQAAMSAVAAGGEVVALDSAGYGPFTIDKSVTVTGEGIHAAITTTAMFANGVTVNAAASDIATIRNLRISGLGIGYAGVAAITAAAVHIENCVVSGFTVVGIDFETSVNAKLFVEDSVVKESGYGMFIQGTVYASIDRVQVVDNTSTGIFAGDNARVAVSNSVAAGGGDGFRSGNTNSRMSIESCVSSGNTSGLVAQNSGNFMYVSNTSVTFNATGLAATGGATMISFGNNRIAENTTAGSFSSTASQQ
jgi:parallel beta helix pectate lyase-like protein